MVQDSGSGIRQNQSFIELSIGGISDMFHFASLSVNIIKLKRSNDQNRWR